MRLRTVMLACAVSGLLRAQSAKLPDFNGLWDGEHPTGDLVRAMAPQKIPFTPYGAERYKNIDMAKNPNGQCLPPGPSRAITGPSPFQLVQSPGAVAILFENHF